MCDKLVIFRHIFGIKTINTMIPILFCIFAPEHIALLAFRLGKLENMHMGHKLRRNSIKMETYQSINMTVLQ